MGVCVRSEQGKSAWAGPVTPTSAHSIVKTCGHSDEHTLAVHTASICSSVCVYAFHRHMSTTSSSLHASSHFTAMAWQPLCPHPATPETSRCWPCFFVRPKQLHTPAARTRSHMQSFIHICLDAGESGLVPYPCNPCTCIRSAYTHTLSYLAWRMNGLLTPICAVAGLTASSRASLALTATTTCICRATTHSRLLVLLPALLRGWLHPDYFPSRRLCPLPLPLPFPLRSRFRFTGRPS
jgi:hypothetical protein